MAQQDHAVVIGIESYRDGDNGIGLAPLKAAENDATHFQQWLLDDAGGDVPADQVQCLVSSTFDAGSGQPNFTQLLDLFRPLVAQCIQGGRIGRRIYIYLAGHGFSDSRQMSSAALLSAEADLLTTTHIAGTLCAEWFRRNGAFDEVVLIMDCCRSVDAMTTVIPLPFPDSSNPNRATEVRKFYAFATLWGQDSRETQIGGEDRGIFTTALLDALRHAKPNLRGRVTGQAVADFTHNRMVELFHPAPPLPADIQVDGSRDIVFAERQAGHLTLTVNLDPFTPGLTVQVTDGRMRPVGQVQAGQNAVSFQVIPGLYKVAIDPGRSTLVEVLADASVTI